MGKNLAGKTASIIAVLVVFVYGILYGSTGPKLGSLKSLLADNIRLGLDLKGGTHLVLQVHVDEAVTSATDRDVARLKAAFQEAGIAASVGKTDPAHPETIVVSGIPPAKVSDARTVLQGNDYSIYDVATLADGTATLTMKLGAINDLKARTLDTSIETISERINSLGVSEPMVQKYGLGENQILVELPGISNPAEVEEAIQSTAKLAVYAVVNGPWENDQAAMTALNGMVPADDMLVHGSATSTGPDEVWLLERASQVEGTDFRDAQPSTDAEWPSKSDV